MSYLNLARQIPAKYRTVILTNNHIYKAVTEFYDWDMMQLWYYYAVFIDPSDVRYEYVIQDGRIKATSECRLCLNNLLEKWKQYLLPALILLEKEKELLNDL